MTVHALFPISVSNRQFSTERVTSALSRLPKRVNQITFLIADWLQLYNRARDRSSFDDIGSVIRDYNDRNNDFVNRQRWISNFLESYPNILSASTKIIGMEHCFDALYANTFRNINILRSVDEEFSRDVSDAAQLFLGNSRKKDNKAAISLSEQYILEEIALNIRLRVKELIDEEYYMGKFHLPMLKVYAGEYSASVQDLLGGEIQHQMQFKFYSLENSEWKLCSE
ncbi:hypothetical protein [Pseudoalteromonas rubra]|uniref:Uncharacterized protein n=1 Tax=Pseudoalteromonas rubra TaxID=43658 RepID=A0A0F4QGK6_9GAMM|nr:hypothetical protein [Pseudoalteromonas rubra]KJZ06746.1 hypothetical protein TW77_18250 [Pseudoalteromonas rubra]